MTTSTLSDLVTVLVRTSSELPSPTSAIPRTPLHQPLLTLEQTLRRVQTEQRIF